MVRTTPYMQKAYNLAYTNLEPVRGAKAMNSTYCTEVIELPVGGKLDNLNNLLEREEKDGYELFFVTALPATVPPRDSSGGPRLLVITKRTS